MKSTLLVLLLIASSFSVKSQNSPSEPGLDVIWNALFVHANLSTSEIGKNCPDYPINESSEARIKNWIAHYPNQVEKMLALLEQRNINPALDQLGIPEIPVKTSDVVPYWPNALSTYGSEASVREALPHMPFPDEFCNTDGYIFDNNKFNAWRDEHGYGQEADETLDLSKQPDLNELFDSSVYPCLGQYYTAIDRWVYEYPKEYYKLMNECGCGGEQVDLSTISTEHQDPYVPPTERVVNIQNVESLANDDGPNDADIKWILSPVHPLELIENAIPELKKESLETILISQGGDAYLNKIASNMNDNAFWFTVGAVAVWYHENDTEKFEMLNAAMKDQGVNNLDALNSKDLDIERVSNSDFVIIFQDLVK